jgi:excisionase family DNA binding protein
MAVAKNDHLLTPAEVATLFRVTPKTVTRWAVAGKLSSIRTLGGHRRYRASDIRELFEPSEWAAVVDMTAAGAQVVDIRSPRG